MMRLAMPVKAMVQRFAFLMLVALGTGLLIVGRADIALTERIRTTVADALTPVLSAFAEPLAAGRALAERAHELFRLHEENARLREENARLLKWQEMARRLEQDNARLRQLLHVTIDPLTSFVTARVVGDTGGSYVRTMLVNAGLRDGVQKGQVAMGEAGVVGRVAEVGQRSARVLLLTDLNSRVPVMLEGSRLRGILSGDNSERPRVEFLPGNSQVSPGDRVLTSGHGGVFPPGLPVGFVASITDGIVRVQPFADYYRLDMVSVVRYDLPRPVAEGEAPALPGRR
ncbi:MAG: rod shape-determining protein MreC [Alphaproteobacteria bacterium]|nr:rod shape-determining protein MreC [Alphaproteobacteria bacterium]